MVVPEGGKVIGLESIPQLVQLGKNNLTKDEKLREWQEKGLIRIEKADGRLGSSADAPFDAIHVGAGATVMPEALIDQLKCPGR